MRHFSKQDWSLLMGNTLDHFDTALYLFLIPIISPLFFPQYDPLIQIILTYSTFSSSTMIKPLTAFAFGFFTKKYNPYRLLCLSLLGLILTTMGIGCLPTYGHAGVYAPCILLLLRVIRTICATGERTIAKLYLLEHKSTTQALSASHYYQSSTIIGYILAAAVANTLTHHQLAQLYWRIPFLLASTLGLLILYQRLSTTHLLHQPMLPEVINNNRSVLTIVWSYKKTIARIACATHFSYITYELPFIFLVYFVPYIQTAITIQDMMFFTMPLLIIDMLLIPLVGRTLQTYALSTIMINAIACLGLVIPILFFFLPTMSLLSITTFRLIIVFIGIIYLCPLNMWLLQQCNDHNKYLISAIGNGLGASWGHTFTTSCLFIFHQTKSLYAPCLLILALISITIAMLIEAQKENIQYYAVSKPLTND